MNRKIFAMAAIFAIGLQLGGCYTDFGPVVTQPEPITQADVAAALHTSEKGQGDGLRGRQSDRSL
jgi:hypothetical protein